jgi:hypothetical protein
VPTDEVSVEGGVIELWDPADPAIAQVGLIADDTGKIMGLPSCPQTVNTGHTTSITYASKSQGRYFRLYRRREVE